MNQVYINEFQVLVTFKTNHDTFNIDCVTFKANRIVFKTNHTVSKVNLQFSGELLHDDTLLIHCYSGR